ncbi:delta-like protein 1 [Callorhinchus milii]|uniref:delta-like protein 1 n=1 Tax=Callorhinchus milii TaxID=7868 RepID=UPI001C3F6F10|nr:delta-like protein 1 [Callorhinchus milii]
MRRGSFLQEMERSGTISLILEAWSSSSSESPSHNTTGWELLLSRFTVQQKVPVSPHWSQDTQRDGHTRITFSYRVVCDAHYYGEGCSVYCRPRNDTFGHYWCGRDGQRVCETGWSQEYCTQPICRSGCSVKHGHCERPGECRCLYGWRGPSCDRCERHPGCLHGSCQQPFQCNCEEGWGGLFCNQDLNYCTHHKPCHHNATCTNTGRGSFTCICPPHLTGPDCGTPTSPCHSAPCRNHGHCTESQTAYHCLCLPGFSGSDCELRSLTCAQSPCFNGGRCVEGTLGHKYRCVCPLGFTGLNCEQKVDHCTSNPCLHGGQCIVSGRSRLCRCNPGFAGWHCEVNVNECASRPCAGGSRCLDQINNYTCVCSPGFTGRDCGERGPSACQAEPCRHGGTCQEGGHGAPFVCQCPAGFLGVWCEQAVSGRAMAGTGLWVTAGLALGALALLLMLCLLTAVLTHTGSRRRSHRESPAQTINNLSHCLLPLAPTKLNNKRAELQLQCPSLTPEHKHHPHWNLVNIIKAELTAERKCHHRGACPGEETLPLKAHWNEDAERGISGDSEFEDTRSAYETPLSDERIVDTEV